MSTEGLSVEDMSTDGLRADGMNADGLSTDGDIIVSGPPGAQCSTLASGLRVVTQNMPHLETVSLGVWVACGARWEAAGDNGISHFLEHMAFKGTMRRTARQIAEEIEQVGGDLNAATSLETTAYYARILKGDVPLALDLLADILNNPTYSEAELERERGVILQEIAAARDTPEDLVFDLNLKSAFPGQAVGRPILGTRASVSNFTAGDLRRFLGENYTPARMVLSAAGAVGHEAVVRHAEALFKVSSGASSRHDAGRRRVEHRARFGGGIAAFDKPLEQSHMVLTYEAPSYRDFDAFIASQVFSGIFGGGMSSRLFQEVREKRGLCYSIYSSCWGLSDSGLFNIYAASAPETMTELVDVVLQQLKLAASEVPMNRELARAKAQMKAGLLMSLESSSARAEQMARHMMAYGRLLTTKELIDRVDAVSADRVRLAAETLLAGAKPAFTIVGNGAAACDMPRDLQIAVL